MRWRKYEWEDCLAMLHGTIDIYEPDSNGAGGIDWSWKRTRVSGGGPVATAVVNYCMEHVGDSYDMGNRYGEHTFDCSSLAFRAYAAAGIDYLDGMTAADEAQYLFDHDMAFTDKRQLQPGDLIVCRYPSGTGHICTVVEKKGQKYIAEAGYHTKRWPVLAKKLQVTKKNDYRMLKVYRRV